MEVDWSLPLGEDGHLALVKRVSADYTRATRIILNKDRMKEFRHGRDQAYNVRKVISFWFQPGVKTLHAKFLTSDD